MEYQQGKKIEDVIRDLEQLLTGIYGETEDWNKMSKEKIREKLLDITRDLKRVIDPEED